MFIALASSDLFNPDNNGNGGSNSGNNTGNNAGNNGGSNTGNNGSTNNGGSDNNVNIVANKTFVATVVGSDEAAIAQGEYLIFDETTVRYGKDLVFAYSIDGDGHIVFYGAPDIFMYTEHNGVYMRRNGFEGFFSVYNGTIDVANSGSNNYCSNNNGNDNNGNDNTGGDSSGTNAYAGKSYVASYITAEDFEMELNASEAITEELYFIFSDTTITFQGEEMDYTVSDDTIFVDGEPLLYISNDGFYMEMGGMIVFFVEYTGGVIA